MLDHARAYSRITCACPLILAHISRILAHARRYLSPLTARFPVTVKHCTYFLRSPACDLLPASSQYVEWFVCFWEENEEQPTGRDVVTNQRKYQLGHNQKSKKPILGSLQVEVLGPGPQRI